MAEIKTLAFDADDTLWINETIFVDTREKCEAILAPYVSAEDLQKKLYETEIKNLQMFGYGIKGFILSMIETAIQLTYGNINGQEIQQIIDLAKEMIQHPIQILPHVRETLEFMNDHFELMIITKGDLFDQESKIARSGLADLFERIEIISEKSEDSYHRIFENYHIKPEQFMMVGNSLKSDILPVCKLGANAVHVPFHTTWEHELISEEQKGSHSYHHLEHMGLLKELLTNQYGMQFN